MKSNVVYFEDYMPHVSVFSDVGDIHIIPLSLMKKIASGSMSIDELDDRDAIVRAIIGGWLRKL